MNKRNVLETLSTVIRLLIWAGFVVYAMGMLGNMEPIENVKEGIQTFMESETLTFNVEIRDVLSTGLLVPIYCMSMIWVGNMLIPTRRGSKGMLEEILAPRKSHDRQFSFFLVFILSNMIFLLVLIGLGSL